MPSWVTVLIRSVFQFVVEYAQNWYQEKEAEVNEWNVKALEGKLEGVKRVKAVEVKMSKIRADVATPADWNAHK